MEKILKMNTSLYYYIAAALFFIWFVGYMGFNQNGWFHLIFLAAVGVIIFRTIAEYSDPDENN